MPVLKMVWTVGFEPTKAPPWASPDPSVQLGVSLLGGGLPVTLTSTYVLYNYFEFKSTARYSWANFSKYFLSILLLPINGSVSKNQIFLGCMYTAALAKT